MVLKNTITKTFTKHHCIISGDEQIKCLFYFFLVYFEKDVDVIDCARFCQYWVWMSDNPKPGILPKPRLPLVVTTYLPFFRNKYVKILIYIYTISLRTLLRGYYIPGNVINNIPLKWDYTFPSVPSTPR